MKFDYSFFNSYGDNLRGHFWKTAAPIGNVILVTGMQEHSNRYDEFAQFLNNHGLDVYCLDHYGQGENVKDGKFGIVPKHTFFKYADTMHELQLRLESSTELPTYVFAHSMGSFIAQAYMQRHNSVSKKVVLCGTSGKIPFSKIGFKLAQMKINDENWNEPSPLFTNLSVGGYAKTIKNREFECDWISYNRENRVKYNEDPMCGYMCSNGFYYNLLEGTSKIFDGKYIKAINEDVDILVVVGEHDAVSANAKRAHELIRRYKRNDHHKINLKVYKNMRHELLNEDDKAVVMKDIVRFFLLDKVQ
jgi:alpha-beta hydrolase superfamily lysophospholipase